MSWLQKILPPKINKLDGTKNSRKAVPEGLWSKCPSCEAVLYQAELEKSLQVCPKCSHHGRLNARQRLDAIFAEPGALIGFAGPRVIEQTVRQTLPEGFQRSEFLLEHGAIDMIVDRREMRDRLGNLLSLFTRIRAT